MSVYVVPVMPVATVVVSFPLLRPRLTWYEVAPTEAGQFKVTIVLPGMAASVAGTPGGPGVVVDGLEAPPAFIAVTL